MKALIRRSVARIAPDVPPQGTRVLMYHAVDAPGPADRLSLQVTQEMFRQQLRIPREEGYAVVPLVSVLEPLEQHDRPRVAITFDDGYRSQACAAAVLRKFGYPATFFVVPRFLDGSRSPGPYWEQWEYLSWDDAADLLEQGFDLGAHSSSRTDLSRCPVEGRTPGGVGLTAEDEDAVYVA